MPLSDLQRLQYEWVDCHTDRTPPRAPNPPGWQAKPQSLELCLPRQHGIADSGHPCHKGQCWLL